MRWLVVVLLVAVAVLGHASSLRVATIQFQSIDGAFDRNLETAVDLVRKAKEQAADVVLLPELSLTGYQLAPDLWDSGELIDGETISSLSKLSSDNEIYLGTTFLEVEGEHFYNTFVFFGPDGRLLGTVRKRKPAGAEGYFFRGDESPHVISTPIGVIGVGICQENYRCFLPHELHSSGAELVLMPFSYPDLTASGGLGSPEGSYLASWYASQLGVPVVTSNKTGNWPQVEGAYFPGQSAIADAGGLILGQLDATPGVLVAEVELNSRLKTAPDMNCVGPFIKDLTLGSWLQRRTTWITIWASEFFGYDPDAEIERFYLESAERRRAALSVDRSQ